MPAFSSPRCAACWVSASLIWLGGSWARRVRRLTPPHCTPRCACTSLPYLVKDSGQSQTSSSDLAWRLWLKPHLTSTTVVASHLKSVFSVPLHVNFMPSIHHGAAKAYSQAPVCFSVKFLTSRLVIVGTSRPRQVLVRHHGSQLTGNPIITFPTASCFRALV